MENDNEKNPGDLPPEITRILSISKLQKYGGDLNYELRRVIITMETQENILRALTDRKIKIGQKKIIQKCMISTQWIISELSKIHT